MVLALHIAAFRAKTTSFDNPLFLIDTKVIKGAHGIGG